LVVGGCAAAVHNRVSVHGRGVFAPDRARAPDYAAVVPDPHEGLEREIVDRLVRDSATPLQPDGLLHALGETLLHEYGLASAFPPYEVVEFAIRWHGLTEMSVDMRVVNARSTQLADYVAERCRPWLATLPATGVHSNRIAVVVGRAPGHGAQTRALVLHSARYCDLEPVHAHVAPGDPLRLRGRILEPFEHPIVVITRADGRVEQRPVGLTPDFDVELPTDQTGAIQVEVVGTGPYGPKPIANFPIWVGEEPPTSTAVGDDSEHSSAEVVLRETAVLVNAERSKRGLRALAPDPLLAKVAQSYCKEMRQYHFYGHVSPRSGAPQDRAESAGYQGAVSENLAWDNRTALEAHRWLMDSPGHASAILDPDATHLGVGVVGYGPASKRLHLVVELFGHLSAWSSWSLEERARRLDEMATGELEAEGSRLDRLMRPPGLHLGLSPRQVRAFTALAMVAMSRRDLDRAEALMRRARSPSSAAPLLVEILRRRAADAPAATAAIAGVLRELPPGHMDRFFMPVRKYPTAAEMDKELRRTQLEPPTYETLFEAVRIAVLWKPMLEHRDVYEAALGVVGSENQRALAKRRHSFPVLNLQGVRDASAVAVAVWARGVRAESFPRRVLGGVAADEASADDLFGSEAREAARYESDLRGAIDSKCGLWTPDAERVWRRRQSATGADRAAVTRILGDVTGWAVGTHDASVVLAGNPFAKLAVFRGPWRPPVTEAALDAEAHHVEAIAEFIRSHRIRVVLAPPAQSLEDFARDLWGGDDLSLGQGGVQSQARELLGRARERWRRLLRECPDTLFVVPNGSGRPTGDLGDVPSSERAQNLLVVGAVDELGDSAVCPGSSGERVAVYDLGIGVDGLLPSGRRASLSGTSRSAARVANLAAKLFALDPTSTPARILAAIVETADPFPDGREGRIANPVHAAARVRHDRRPASR
jgi:hypothetical protein